MVLGCVLGGYVAMGGKLAVLYQPFELVIIGGAGAFVIVAGEELSFAEAVQRKLILEIASAEPTGPPRKHARADQ